VEFGSYFLELQQVYLAFAGNQCLAALLRGELVVAAMIAESTICSRIEKNEPVPCLFWAVLGNVVIQIHSGAIPLPDASSPWYVTDGPFKSIISWLKQHDPVAVK
jgi:hypothetical protein